MPNFSKNQKKNRAQKLLATAVLIYAILSIISNQDYFIALKPIQSRFKVSPPSFGGHGRIINNVRPVASLQEFAQMPNCQFTPQLPPWATILHCQLRNDCVGDIFLQYKGYRYKYAISRFSQVNLSGLDLCYTYGCLWGDERRINLVRNNFRVKPDFIIPIGNAYFQSRNNHLITVKCHKYDANKENINALEVVWHSPDRVYHSLLMPQYLNQHKPNTRASNSSWSASSWSNLFELAEQIISNSVY